MTSNYIKQNSLLWDRCKRIMYSGNVNIHIAYRKGNPNVDGMRKLLTADENAAFNSEPNVLQNL